MGDCAIVDKTRIEAIKEAYGTNDVIELEDDDKVFGWAIIGFDSLADLTASFTDEDIADLYAQEPRGDHGQ